MSKKPSKKHFIATVMALMSAALIVVLPLRVYEYLRLMKVNTGLFSGEGKVCIYVLYAFLFAVTVCILVLSSVGSKTHKFKSGIEKNVPMFAVSLLLSISVFFDAGYSVYKFAVSVGKENTAQMMSEFTNKVVTYLGLIEGIFAVLAGAFFVLLAVKYFGTKLNFKKVQILAVMPVIWEASRIMIKFMSTVSFIKTSELLLEMFMICFTMLFLCAFIKFIYSYELTRAQYKLYGYGTTAVLLSFVCSIPRYILLIFGASNALYSSASLYSVCDLFMGIFILSFLFSVMEGSKEKKLVGEEYGIQ